MHEESSNKEIYFSGSIFHIKDLLYKWSSEDKIKLGKKNTLSIQTVLLVLRFQKKRKKKTKKHTNTLLFRVKPFRMPLV